MRHLIKNFILVALSYSIALSAPAAAKSSASDNFIVVKNYVNGSGKKTFLGVLQKMEKDLPSNHYEDTIQKLKGLDGKMWFQAAKLADNYSYFRVNNSKVFIRTTAEKGKTVFYANGVRIDESDLSGKSLKLAELKMLRAYAKGFSSGKSAFLDFFKSSESMAGDIQVNPETAKGSTAVVTPAQDECDAIKKEYAELEKEDKELARQYAGLNGRCGLVAAPGGGTPVATQGKGNIWIIIGMLVLFLLLMSKRKKKKSSETPEPVCGVGRGLDNDGKCVPRPTPPPTGGGHVNCDPNGQCPNDGTSTTTPGTPTSPPTTPVSDDPNYYGESTVTTGRDASSVPVLKSKTKKK